MCVCVWIFFKIPGSPGLSASSESSSESGGKSGKGEMKINYSMRLNSPGSRSLDVEEETNIQ